MCAHIYYSQTKRDQNHTHTRSHMGHEISWMWEDVECVHNILWYILRRGIYPSFIHHTFRRSEEGLLYYYYYSLSSIIWRNRWNYCMFSFLSLCEGVIVYSLLCLVTKTHSSLPFSSFWMSKSFIKYFR